LRDKKPRPKKLYSNFFSERKISREPLLILSFHKKREILLNKSLMMRLQEKRKLLRRRELLRKREKLRERSKKP